MGLFTQRPEDPSEWAGLPSEPHRPRSDAELLPDAPPVADPGTAVLGGIPGVTSISIPVDPEGVATSDEAVESN